MDDKRKVDVAGLLESIASTLVQNQNQLNQIDMGAGGKGTHGNRLTQAFKTAAEAARNANSSDTGKQLAAAAQAMRQHGQGKAVGFYANGLQQTAAQFTGQNGISLADLAPFLQSLVSGVQNGNPAKPGQGTMLDALLPAVSTFLSAQQQGLDTKSAALQALTSAATGAMQTAKQPQGGSLDQPWSQYPPVGANIDPGAASATSVLGGIMKALLPGVTGALSQNFSGAGGQQSSPGMSQSDPGTVYGQATDGNDPMSGFEGLLDALGGEMGGQDSDGQKPNAKKSQAGSDAKEGSDSNPTGSV